MAVKDDGGIDDVMIDQGEATVLLFFQLLDAAAKRQRALEESLLTSGAQQLASSTRS